MSSLVTSPESIKAAKDKRILHDSMVLSSCIHSSISASKSKPLSINGTFRSQGSEHLRHAPQGQGQLSNYTVSGTFGLPRIRDHFRNRLLEQGQLSNYALTGTTSCFPGRGEYFPVMPYRDKVSLVFIL
jgi:hypothetical protein